MRVHNKFISMSTQALQVLLSEITAEVKVGVVWRGVVFKVATKVCWFDP